jgi:hypothetical protein
MIIARMNAVEVWSERRSDVVNRALAHVTEISSRTRQLGFSPSHIS